MKAEGGVVDHRLRIIPKRRFLPPMITAAYPME